MSREFKVHPEETLPPGALDEIARVPILYVFFRRAGEWRVRSYHQSDAKNASKDAKRNRTVVIASYVEVPRAADPEWSGMRTRLHTEGDNA